jgi:hypothetical protein
MLRNSKEKVFPICEIGNIHNDLNNYYIKEVYMPIRMIQKNIKILLVDFQKSLEELYDLIQDMKRYNNNNN